MTTASDDIEVLTPSDEEVSTARELDAKLRRAPNSDFALVVTIGGREHVFLDRASGFFRALIREVAQGRPVGLIDLDQELSTTQAAELLGVSRPTLVGLLKEGLIPHRKVGTHRRIARAALHEYKKTHVPPRDLRPFEERLRATTELLAMWHEAEEQAEK